MTNIDFAYINYEHGGLDGGSYHGSTGSYDFTGLVRILGDQDRWPDVAVVGEAEQYEFRGGAGLYGAASALSEASGKPYLPVLGTLPREWGPIGPAMFIDAQKIRVRRWHSGREPDFYARNRNLLVATLAGRTDVFHVVSGHGDIFDTDMRLADAKMLRRYANPAIPCAVMMDWNSVLSNWDNDKFQTYTAPWQYASRIQWQHGPSQADPRPRADTRARDFLCGWWDDQGGARVGGLGFYDVLEIAGLHGETTNLPHPGGRPCTAIDGAVVNEPWAKALLHETVHVHAPRDPENPDSDHKRLSFTIDV